MLALASSSIGLVGPAAPICNQQVRANVRMESLDELKALAVKANPVVGYWDPINLVDYEQFSNDQSINIGFLRQAEIKHGRVAMAAFVGFIVQSNGIHFPWNLTPTVSYADISAAGGPAAQWDALPTPAKLQIILFIGFLEVMSESTYVLEQSGMKHYMRGGKPGAFPSLKKAGFPHPIPLDLFDPFGLSKNASPEKKEKGLVTEINNGRLAMLGIFGFAAETKIPGSVPALTSLGLEPYSGEYMAPFAAGDMSLPYVTEMLKLSMF
jgi:hypothetical protein